MPVQQTSLWAYRKLTLIKKESMYNKIIKFLSETQNAYSNREISELINKPINSITPRVKELRDKGIIINAGTQKDIYTEMTVNTWKLKENWQEHVIIK